MRKQETKYCDTCRKKTEHSVHGMSIKRWICKKCDNENYHQVMD